MVGLPLNMVFMKTVRILLLSVLLVVLSFALSTNVSAKPNCVVGGCSGEICTDIKSEPRASICIYREEYACFKYAKCEVLENGECGWQFNEDYNECVSGKIIVTPNLTPHIEPTVKPEPTTAPICGNNICEVGEADSENCPPPCDETGGFCMMRPCFLLAGSCPGDCVSPSVVPTEFPDPKPSITIYPPASLTPVPSVVISPTPMASIPGKKIELISRFIEKNVEKMGKLLDKLRERDIDKNIVFKGIKFYSFEDFLNFRNSFK